MDAHLGVAEQVIKTALSVAIGARADAGEPPFAVGEIDSSPSQVIVAFPGSWSPDEWFAGDGEAKSFGETKIDGKKFPSLRRLGTDALAVVNEVFAARFLRILEDGNQTFCKKVLFESRMMPCFRRCLVVYISDIICVAISSVRQVSC